MFEKVFFSHEWWPLYFISLSFFKEFTKVLLIESSECSDPFFNLHISHFLSIVFCLILFWVKFSSKFLKVKIILGKIGFFTLFFVLFSREKWFQLTLIVVALKSTMNFLIRSLFQFFLDIWELRKTTMNFCSMAESGKKNQLNFVS